MAPRVMTDRSLEGRVVAFSGWLDHHPLPQAFRSATWPLNPITLTLSVLVLAVLGLNALGAATALTAPLHLGVAKLLGLTGPLAAALAAKSLAETWHEDALMSAVAAFGLAYLNQLAAPAQTGLGILTGIAAGLVFGLLNHGSSLAATRLELPAGAVPPNALAFLQGLIAPLVTVLATAGVSLLTWQVAGTTWWQLGLTWLDRPLLWVTTSIGGYLLLYSFANLVYTRGIHQGVISGTLTEPFITIALAENLAAWANGQPLAHTVTTAWQVSFTQLGGSGATLALVLATLVARKPRLRELGQVALPAGIFEINEPIIFGYPIVQNRVMTIPFLLVPVVNGLVAYAATAAGWIAPTMIALPWITPPVLSGFLATGGDWRAAALQLVLLPIGALLYLPFMHLAAKAEN